LHLVKPYKPNLDEHKLDVARTVLGIKRPGDPMHPNSNISLSHPLTQRRVSVNTARLRVLVVDDNPNAGEALATYLALHEMECQIAHGGFEAISAGVAWQPDVIVMDISMPVCDGFQAAFALRRDSRTAGTAIIAFTALDETEVNGNFPITSLTATAKKDNRQPNWSRWF